MRRGVIIAVFLSAVLAPVATTQADPYLAVAMNNSDSIQMFDPYDGTHLGQLLVVPTVYTSRVPVAAELGPDGNIYVADRNQKAVFQFNQEGTYLGVYAGPEDGLNDYVRDIDFMGNDLLVSVESSSGSHFIARYDGPHSQIADFISDDCHPHGMYVMADGRVLVSNYMTGGSVRLYGNDGTYINDVLTGHDRPEQIQFDPSAPGSYLMMETYPRQFTDFDVDGTIYVQNTIVLGDTRGVYRLGNGNLLVGCNMGVYEVDSRDGAVIERKLSGDAMYINLIPEPASIALLLLGASALLRRNR